jgi:redox-sensing transcriptional repressor
MFDSDLSKVDTVVGGVRVRAIDDLPAVVQSMNVSIGVLATPGAAAQEAADLMVRAGITSILNFAPVVIATPRAVRVRKVDLASELQILSYYEDRRQSANPSADPARTASA